MPSLFYIRCKQNSTKIPYSHQQLFTQAKTLFLRFFISILSVCFKGFSVCIVTSSVYLICDHYSSVWYFQFFRYNVWSVIFSAVQHRCKYVNCKYWKHFLFGHLCVTHVTQKLNYHDYFLNCKTVWKMIANYKPARQQIERLNHDKMDNEVYFKSLE